MAKLNLDDFFKDLATPDPDAPREPSPQQAGKGSDAPRPPDISGGGLGEELDPSAAADTAPRGRIKPNDALAGIFKPGAAPAPGVELGEYLLGREVIKSEQLTTARRIVKQTPGKRLAQVLIESGANEQAVQEAVAAIAGLPFERVDANAADPVEPKAFSRLTPEYCRQHNVLPLRREGTRLVLGTINPDDVFLIDEVKRRLNAVTTKLVLIMESDVKLVIDSLTEASAAEQELSEEDILADVDEDDVEVVKEESKDDNVEEEAESSPVVRYVNYIIQSAIKEGASDIHIEPDEKVVKVRFRIDGVLFEMMNRPKRWHAALTSRIKIMANLDIAERRMPQDGRIRATVLGRKLDLRVSTVPTPKGEKTVMRILDQRSINVELEDLGFSEDTLAIWKKQIDLPHGIILVTGPTGSGKTTTLYSSIKKMDIKSMNVSTVEDPVEYNLQGITQIQIHEKIDMTFAKALKALLRQDPDVIMLGEVRDMETATIAIQAALTGHLVLSTLHTNDAPSSITRLINIGIEPFLVGAALNSVLAQRLVRKNCKHCSVEEDPNPEIVDFLVMHGVTRQKLVAGKGCSHCRNTGYSGRLGLYELLLLDDFLRDAVAGNPNVTEFRRICSERGMVSLREDGFDKINKGLTTVEEVLRVTDGTI